MCGGITQSLLPGEIAVMLQSGCNWTHGLYTDPSRETRELAELRRIEHRPVLVLHVMERHSSTPAPHPWEI